MARSSGESGSSPGRFGAGGAGAGGEGGVEGGGGADGCPAVQRLPLSMRLRTRVSRHRQEKEGTAMEAAVRVWCWERERAGGWRDGTCRQRKLPSGSLPAIGTESAGFATSLEYSAWAGALARRIVL